MTKPLIPINPAGLEDIAESLLAPLFGGNNLVSVTGNHIILSDIVCTDADSRVFEKYDKLAIATDVFRGTENYDGKQIKKHLLLTPYQATAHCQQNGLFLPSSALMVNIHYALFKEAVEKQPDGTYKVKNAAAEQALKKFQDRGDGVGGHWVNTLIDWKAGVLVHYPHNTDFSQHGGTSQVNASLSRKAYPFHNNGFASSTLEEALKSPSYKAFLQNYTGLSDPTVLVELAKYHGKTARIWVSSAETKAAWFGCGNTYLSLYANFDLDSGNAARGVFLKTP